MTDGDSWLNGWPVRERTSYPVLFDRAGQPKPAFDAVIRMARPENLANDDVLNPINMAFHQQIALASGNTVLAPLRDALQDLFTEEQRLILGIFGSRSRDHQEHLAIFEALEKRDEALAVEPMRMHLEGVQAAVEQWDPEHHPVS